MKLEEILKSEFELFCPSYLHYMSKISASPRKKKKASVGAISQQPTQLGGENPPVKNISAASAFISADHFQQPLHPSPFLQAPGAATSQPPHFFAMQPTAQFQSPTSCQPPHPQAHQMFVSPNGQLMTAAPMVSIAVPTANSQQSAISAGSAAPGTTPAGCYGSPFQPFFMSQSPPGQPASMVAWQPSAAWSAYQHAAAAAAAAAATASSASTQQYVQQQQQQHQNHQAFSQSSQQHQSQTHTQQQQQQQQQHFVFAGGQSTGSSTHPAAAAYPQQLYLTSAPG